MGKWLKQLVGLSLGLLSLSSYTVALEAQSVSLPLISSAIHSAIPASPNLKLIGVHDFQPSRHVTQLKTSGAQVVRLPVTWHLLEAQGAGITGDWFWTDLDAQVRAIESAGAQVIIQMAQSPCWASSAPQKRCQDPNYIDYIKYPPSNPDDYGRAFARIASRYKGRILAYEIWNEPNLTVNWKPFNPRPRAINDGYNSFVDLAAAQRYTALVKATYSRLKAADPNAFVLAGSIAGGDAAYVKALYTAGIKGYFDALAIHPYTDVYPGLSTSFGPAECPAAVLEPKFWCFKLGVERINQAMRTAGDTRKIWFTEFGFDSNTQWNGSGLTGQATHLEQAIKLIQGWNFVPVVAWYALVDQNSNINQREYQFGLFSSFLNIKPSGSKFKALLAQHTSKPIPLAPLGTISQTTPIYSWQAVPNAVKYKIWLNEYSIPNIPGKINTLFTPTQAGCVSGGICSVRPNVPLARTYAEWWVTAYDAKGTALLSVSAKFNIK